ncbi:MAG TPA: porin [Bacteroidia bacterium]|nr:porin [Bacteroidia bacterium]
MKKTLTLTAIALMFLFNAKAQESEENPLDTLARSVAAMRDELNVKNRLKISGYIQPQFQMADSAGQASFNGGNFPKGVDNRFMVRRGRVKFQYTSAPGEKGWATSMYVLQFDVTEKGLAIKDAYVKITDPWIGWFNLTAGVSDRPFGFEVGYSSSMRESPERGRMSQLLFPGEREVGAKLTIQGPKSSNWNWLALDAGFFNGNGIGGAGIDVSDWDNTKDFIGHLYATKTNESQTVKYSGGISYYNGGFRIDSVNVYKMGADGSGVGGFIIDTKAEDNGAVALDSRTHSKRVYYGIDGQVSFDWHAGMTTLRGEFITGEQPGSAVTFKSPNNNSPFNVDIYSRKFNGAYFYFIQNIMSSPWQFVAKYDWFDPNTDVKGDEIGKAVDANTKQTNSVDIKYNTIGLGLVYRWDANVKITAYYDMVKNETSNNLSGYTADIPDNVFTLRMQVKF